MSSSEISVDGVPFRKQDNRRAPGHSALAALRQLFVGERVQVLRELDDFLLRDIGASGDDIWRVRRLRNGQRPTLLVG